MDEKESRIDLEDSLLELKEKIGSFAAALINFLQLIRGDRKHMTSDYVEVGVFSSGG